MNARIGNGMRTLLLVVAAGQLVFALIFLFAPSLVTMVWPWPATSPLSATFVASIFAAAAASTGWAAGYRRERALAGIALDYLVIFVPFSVFSAMRAIQGAGGGVGAFAVACAVGVVFGAWLLRYSLRFEWRNPGPTPLLIRGSFVVITGVLIFTGLVLVANVPNILPWTVTPDLSVLFGLIFFGAAAYFAFGAAVPVIDNARGQLAGFLAYDIVLVIPFLVRLPTISDAFRLSLWIYLGVITYSAALAIYYLFVQPTTRIWRASDT